MTVPLIVLAAFSVFAGFLNPGFGILQGAAAGPLARAGLRAARARGRRRQAATRRRAHRVAARRSAASLAFVVGSGARLLDVRPARRARRRKRLAAGAARALPAACSTSGASTSSTTRPSSRRSTRSPTRPPRSTRRSSTASSRGSRRSSSPRSGTVLRAFQNGVVHVYAAMMVVGLAAIGLVLRRAARRTRRCVDARQRRLRGHRRARAWATRTAGTPTATASPTSRTSAPTPTLKLHLEPGKTQTVQPRGEERVRARAARRRFHVARPQAPTSSL